MKEVRSRISATMAGSTTEPNGDLTKNGTGMFTVAKTPLATTLPSLERVISSRHSVLTREDTKAVLGIVSPRYPVVQPDTLQGYVNGIASSFNMEAEDPIISGRGELVWWNLRGTTMSITGDEITKYLILSSGYDGKTPLFLVPSTFRAFCKNTLALAQQGATEKLRIIHKGDIQPAVEQIPNLLQSWGFQMEELETTYKKMATMTLADPTTGFKTIATSLGYNEDNKKKWLSRIDDWNTAYREEVAAFGNQSHYTLFQAVTKEMEMRAKENTRKAFRFDRSNIFGTLAKEKLQVLQLLKG